MTGFRIVFDFTIPDPNSSFCSQIPVDFEYPYNLPICLAKLRLPTPNLDLIKVTTEGGKIVVTICYNSVEKITQAFIKGKNNLNAHANDNLNNLNENFEEKQVKSVRSFAAPPGYSCVPLTNTLKDNILTIELERLESDV